MHVQIAPVQDHRGLAAIRDQETQLGHGPAEDNARIEPSAWAQETNREDKPSQKRALTRK